MENYNVYQDYASVLFKEENARGTRKLYELGYSPTGDSGDVSARDPRTGLIYVSGSPDWVTQKNLGDARGWERSIVDIDGNHMVPWSKPTIEASTHLAIYRARPEVGAIVHTHGEWVSVFAMLGMDIPLVLAGQGEQGVIRCAGYGRAGSPELNKYVVEALGTTAKAALMRNHGAIAVADTLDHAFEVAAWLETVAEKAYYSILLASKRPVDVAAVMQDIAK